MLTGAALGRLLLLLLLDLRGLWRVSSVPCSVFAAVSLARARSLLALRSRRGSFFSGRGNAGFSWRIDPSSGACCMPRKFSLCEVSARHSDSDSSVAAQPSSRRIRPSSHFHPSDPSPPVNSSSSPRTPRNAQASSRHRDEQSERATRIFWRAVFSILGPDTHLRLDLTGTRERAVDLTHVDWTVSVPPFVVAAVVAAVVVRT